MTLATSSTSLLREILPRYVLTLLLLCELRVNFIALYNSVLSFPILLSDEKNIRKTEADSSAYSEVSWVFIFVIYIS